MFTPRNRRMTILDDYLSYLMEFLKAKNLKLGLNQTMTKLIFSECYNFFEDEEIQSNLRILIDGFTRYFQQILSRKSDIWINDPQDIVNYAQALLEGTAQGDYIQVAYNSIKADDNVTTEVAQCISMIEYAMIQSISLCVQALFTQYFTENIRNHELQNQLLFLISNVPDFLFKPGRYYRQDCIKLALQRSKESLLNKYQDMYFQESIELTYEVIFKFLQPQKPEQLSFQLKSQPETQLRFNLEPENLTLKFQEPVLSLAPEVQEPRFQLVTQQEPRLSLSSTSEDVKLSPPTEPIKIQLSGESTPPRLALPGS